MFAKFFQTPSGSSRRRFAVAMGLIALSWSLLLAVLWPDSEFSDAFFLWRIGLGSQRTIVWGAFDSSSATGAKARRVSTDDFRQCLAAANILRKSAAVSVCVWGGQIDDPLMDGILSRFTVRSAELYTCVVAESAWDRLVTHEGLVNLDVWDSRIDDRRRDRASGGATFTSSSLRAISVMRSNARDDDFEVLASAPQLEDLAITDAPISDVLGERLGRCQHLKSLIVENTAMTGETIPFEQLNELRAVCVGSPFSDEAARRLARARGVTALTISGGSVETSGMLAIAELRELWRLDLSGLKLSAEALNVVERFPKMEELALNELTLPKSAWNAISRLPRLRRLEVRGATFDAVDLMKLLDMPNLAFVNVRGTTLTERDATEFVTRHRMPCRIVGDFGAVDSEGH